MSDLNHYDFSQPSKPCTESAVLNRCGSKSARGSVGTRHTCRNWVSLRVCEWWAGSARAWQRRDRLQLLRYARFD